MDHFLQVWYRSLLHCSNEHTRSLRPFKRFSIGTSALVRRRQLNNHCCIVSHVSHLLGKRPDPQLLKNNRAEIDIMRSEYAYSILILLRNELWIYMVLEGCQHYWPNQRHNSSLRSS